MPELTVAALSGMTREQFVGALGFLFEHSPWVVDEVWAWRPFGSRAELHAKLVAVVRYGGEERHLALLRAHPDLAGRAAIAGELTAASAGEQASAGLDRLSAAEFERFHALNDAYRERFGFPFIICVRENTRESILAAFEARLANEPAGEVATALGEIGKIARLRLAEVVAE